MAGNSIQQGLGPKRLDGLTIRAATMILLAIVGWLIVVILSAFAVNWSHAAVLVGAAIVAAPAHPIVRLIQDGRYRNER